MPPPSFKWLPPLTLTVRYRDLGDAPDSTSHYTTAMPAYGGVPAAFPTVFDPVAGPVQGPAHLNPRPFHLGRRVSPEAEADIGPDLDPTNNIIPLANIANRDRRDDGLSLKLLSFGACQRSLIPLRIVIRSAAVAYFQSTGGSGYLNLWLDGNHDGDWADSFSCPAEQRAFEHIVIDHAIDVAALGPGVHTLVVPAGLVPWSGQGSWLRATLSEKPSNKTLNAGGIDYGDGRGYATPFLLGETEDYFVRPRGTAHAGPDIGLDLLAGWGKVASGGATDLMPASPNLEIHLTASYFKIDYRNQGSETATDVVLTFLVHSALRDLEPRLVALVGRQPWSVTKEPGQILISLGDVEPGDGGAYILRWVRPCPSCVGSLSAAQASDIVTGSVIVESSNDINLDNNRADSSVEYPELIEVGFMSPDDLFMRSYGATCHNDITLRGKTSPDTTLEVILGDPGAGKIEVTSGPDGTFEQLINLANGRHQIFLIPKVGGGDIMSASGSAVPKAPSTVKRIDKATPNLVIGVNNHLPWNPSSLAFVDSKGGAILPLTLGFENQAGWYGHLKLGETYQLRVEYCGADPEPVIQARFLGRVVSLEDPDGDGFFHGDIRFPFQMLLDAPAAVAASAPLTISINSGDVEKVFGGTVQATAEGVVYDSGTGQPVSATVTLLQAIEADPEAGFELWSGAASGQANPQLVDGDGLYAFWPEPGTYHVDASRPGYQPYRSWNVQTTGEPVNQDLPLAVAVSGEADYVVEIGADGFEPAVLRVLPGSIVKWVNSDIKDHTSTSFDPRLAGPGVGGNGGWDSGRLSSGDSFLHQFGSEGSFRYADRANPGHTARIEVGGHRIYLPLVRR